MIFHSWIQGVMNQPEELKSVYIYTDMRKSYFHTWVSDQILLLKSLDFKSKV